MIGERAHTHTHTHREGIMYREKDANAPSPQGLPPPHLHHQHPTLHLLTYQGEDAQETLALTISNSPWLP